MEAATRQFSGLLNSFTGLKNDQLKVCYSTNSLEFGAVYEKLRAAPFCRSTCRFHRRPFFMPDLRRQRARSLRRIFKNSRFVHLREILPRARKGRNPLFARAGGSSIGGPLPAGRATRGLTALVVLALLLIAGRFFVGQQLDVTGQIDRIVRRELIPQLEKELGEKIEIGEIESDWASRVILHNVVIGRNAKLPTGALAKIRRVTLNLDIVGLALKRAQIPDAIQSATLDGPEIYLERNRQNVWNFQKFLKKQGDNPPIEWTGRVVINDGRVFVRDETLRGAKDIPLVLDARQINGALDAIAGYPLRVAATIGQTLAPLRNVKIGQIAVRGAFQTNGKFAAATLELPPVPAPFLAEYALPKDEVVANSGTVGGRVQVVWNGKDLAPRGELQLANLNLSGPALRLPNQKNPLQILALRGPIRFAGTAASTPKLEFTVAGSPWQIAGDLATSPTAIFDLKIASTRADLARLAALSPNKLPAQFQSGFAKLSLRLNGRADDFAVSGAADIPNVKVQAPQGAFASSLAHAVFAAQIAKNAAPRAAVRLNAPNALVQIPNQGRARGAVLEATARFNGNGPFDLQANLKNWSGFSDQYGEVRGPLLQVSASSPSLQNLDLRGVVRFSNVETSGVRLAKIAPDVAAQIQQIGLVSGAARFAGIGKNGLNSPNARADADFQIPTIFARNPDLGPVRARNISGTANLAPGGAIQANFRIGFLNLEGGQIGPLQLENLNGGLRFADGKLQSAGGRGAGDAGDFAANLGANGQIYVSAPDVRLPASKINELLAPQGLNLQGAPRGLLVVSGTTKNLSARFDFRAPFVAINSIGDSQSRARLSNVRLTGSGQIRVGAANPLQNANAVLTAQSAIVASGKLGRTGIVIPTELNGTRAVNLRAVFAGDLQNPSGNLAATRVAFPLPKTPDAKIQFVTLGSPSAVFAAKNGEISLPRVSANLAGGNITGQATIEKIGIRGAFLGRDLSVASLQRLAAPASLKTARASGKVDIKTEIAPAKNGFAATTRLVLENGQIQTNDATIPLDNARGTFILAGANGPLQIRDFSAWSQGGRFAANGAVDLTKSEPGFVGTLGFQQARLATLAGLPGLEAVKAQNVDGLVSGEFAADLAGARQSLDGRIRLELATAAGADIRSATADVTLENTANGPEIKLANLRGVAEGAPFLGSAEVSSARNFWSVKLQTEGVSALRLGQLGIKKLAIPVVGDLAADVDISGTLKENGKWVLRPQNGYAKLVTGPLRFRGENLGGLTANVSVKEGIIQAQDVSLNRTTEAGRETTLSISGDLPIEPRDGNLDARVKLTDAPLEFALDLLRQTRRTLKEGDVSVPLLDSAADTLAKLPNVTGDIGLDATLTGQWTKPRIEVASLTLRNGRASLPSGGLSPPATLDAAFVYDAGRVQIDKADFRLKKAFIPKDNPDEEADDTLVRVAKDSSVVPNGAIDLQADILNANLAELALWLPVLRGKDGRPVLRGQLPIFSVAVAGQTRHPEVTGSIEAENLTFNAYTLDALRISRFEISNGNARIEPGNLTVAKGNFQASSAWGRIPWSWTPPGPIRNAPMEVHFPLQTKDFGALAGVFVPVLTAAGADEFSGGIDVVGTLDAPQITGAVSIKGGQFRLDPRQDLLEAGVTDLSGTIRFANGNRLIIDADDPLKGKLVAASNVKAKATGNTAPAKTKFSKDAPQLAGNFLVKGNAQFDLDPNNAFDPALALARQRYDFTASLNDISYSAPGMPMVQNGSFAAIWKTGAGEPRLSQKVRWMLAAQGKARKKKGAAGQIVSVAAFTLPPDFGRGLNALLRSEPENFSDYAAFADLPVGKRVSRSYFPDGRSQVVFQDFVADVKNVAYGTLSGRIVLDERAANQQDAPPEAVGLTTAALTERLRASRRKYSVFGPSFDPQDDFDRTVRTATPANRRVQTDPSDSSADRVSLRLAGELTLSDAEIYGAPESGGGVAGKLSLLPSVPRLDMKLTIGQNVRVVSPVLRAVMGGEIVVSGTPQSPQIFGVLATREGQVRFPNARARLEEGQITVAATRDPESDTLRTRVEIDATASGQVGRYAITLRLSGPLDLEDKGAQNLKVDVTSNPPLSQDEAFAQLLGTSVRDSNSDGTFQTGDANQAYARAVLQLVTAPLFSGVENSVASALGLTSVGFEYRFNEAIGVQLTKAIGDRVYITYRRTLGGIDAGERTPYQLRIDYRIKGDLLLGLQTDEREIKTLTLQKSFRF